MATIGTLAVNIVAQTQQFNSGLDKSRNMLQRFTGGLHGAAERARGFITAFRASAIIEVGAALVKLGADAETTRVRFATLLGSMSQAKTLLAELQQFSASTPFQFGDLADTSAKLLSFGVSADDVMKRIKTLGDIAAGSGARIGELGSIFGKMKSSGVVALGDLNQLGDRGIPIFEVLKKQLGLSGAELRKFVSTGKLGFPAVLQALEDMTGKSGLFNDAMKKQSETLAGTWSTLMDNLKLLGTEIGKVLVPILKVLVQILTFVVKVIRTFVGWIFKAVGAIGRFFGFGKKQEEQVKRTTKAIKQQTVAKKELTEAEKKAIEQQKQMVERGKAIAQQFRTPTEVFRDRVAELNKLVAAGALSWTVYSRAVAGATKELRSSIEQERRARQQQKAQQGVGAVVRGSVAAFSASQEDRRQRAAQLAEEKRQTEIQKDMLGELKKANVQRPEEAIQVVQHRL